MANFVRHIALATEQRIWPLLSRPETWLRSAATTLNVILVIALAWVLAGLTAAALWNRTPSSIGTAPPPGPAAGESVMAQPADYAAIVAWHLFGRVETAQPVETAPVALPATPLNLRLVGVFFIERGADRALALIAEGNGLERGYRIGESLPGGAQLEQIQRDRVVVSRDGRQEVLNLPKLDEIGKAPASREMPPATEPEPVTEPEPAIPPVEPASFRAPREIDASAVAARLRDSATTRPQTLEDIAFASPYVRNGQFVGFRLRPGRDRQLMPQLGLSSGDVITEVNGNRLNNPMQGLAMLQELLNADQIRVRVLRDGAEIPLTFSLGGPTTE